MSFKFIQKRTPRTKLTYYGVLFVLFFMGSIKGAAYYKFIFYILIFCSFA